MSEKSKLLEYVTRTATANDEKDVEVILKLMHPVDDPDEMGETFEDVLGYNPIVYYDEKTIEDLLKTGSESLSEASKEIIREHSSEIISEVLNHYQMKKEKHLAESMVAVIRNFIEDDDVAIIADALSEALGIQIPFESDEDDDDDDSGIVPEDFSDPDELDDLDTDLDDDDI